MKDNAKAAKASYIISIISVTISIVGMVFAFMHLRYSLLNQKETGFALTSFGSMLVIFFANIIQFILIRKKHKSSSK